MLFLLCTFAFSCLSLLLLPESPEILYDQGKYDQCRQSLSYIARINGKPPICQRFEIEIKEREGTIWKEHSATGTLADVLRQRIN